MNKGTYGNKTPDKRESGEIVYSITSPGDDYIGLDGRTITPYKMRSINKRFLERFTGNLFNAGYATWTTQTVTLSSTNLQSVAYGGGTWVAVGDIGGLCSSTDGITWISRTSNFGATNMYAVTYGNGIFVAGAAGASNLRTSTDGVTWVTQNATHSIVYSLAYGNNLFVSGGNGMSSSTDAITWISRTSNFGASSIYAVAYGNGIWVAAGESGQIRTSTNAITWVTQTSNFGTTAIRSVAYGNGLWIAVGDTGQLRTSTDAITWTTQTSNFGTSIIYSIAYGNNLWVAGGLGLGRVTLTSTDGITWAIPSSAPYTASSFGLNGAAYGNRKWVVVGAANFIGSASTSIIPLPNVPFGWVKS